MSVVWAFSFHPLKTVVFPSPLCEAVAISTGEVEEPFSHADDLPADSSPRLKSGSSLFSRTHLLSRRQGLFSGSFSAGLLRVETDFQIPSAAFLSFPSGLRLRSENFFVVPSSVVFSLLAMLTSSLLHSPSDGTCLFHPAIRFVFSHPCGAKMFFIPCQGTPLVLAGRHNVI